MPATKSDIITQLQKDILSLQGFKPTLHYTGMDMGLGPINNAFPNARFPSGAIHEFLSGGAEDRAACNGFIAGLLSPLMKNGGVSAWISTSRKVFPPALKSFGIEPDHIIFIDLQKEKDILWVMEEALKCGALASVVAELQDLSFTASRRLQLAVEESQVTGFIIRNNSQKLTTTACVTRWRITTLPSESPEGLPGIGFPRWNVELLKVRNGKPGSWQIVWANETFQHLYRFAAIADVQQKKTG